MRTYLGIHQAPCNEFSMALAASILAPYVYNHPVISSILLFDLVLCYRHSHLIESKSTIPLLLSLRPWVSNQTVIYKYIHLSRSIPHNIYILYIYCEFYNYLLKASSLSVVVFCRNEPLVLKKKVPTGLLFNLLLAPSANFLIINHYRR